MSIRINVTEPHRVYIRNGWFRNWIAKPFQSDVLLYSIPFWLEFAIQVMTSFAK
jgi:hypothetical protein